VAESERINPYTIFTGTNNGIFGGNMQVSQYTCILFGKLNILLNQNKVWVHYPYFIYYTNLLYMPEFDGLEPIS